MLRKKLFWQLPLLAIALFIFSCDLGDITIPSGSSELTVSAKSDDNIMNSSDLIVINEAKALLSTVEIEVDNSGGRTYVIKYEPVVVNFALNGNLSLVMQQFIVRDIYSKILFQIHRPEENETVSDAEFTTGGRYSFIVKGTYNGTAFVYKSKTSLNVSIPFSKVTNINLQTSAITFLFNKRDWFRNGTTEVNPSDPQFEALIDANIKNSFRKAFRDDNKDGIED